MENNSNDLISFPTPSSHMILSSTFESLIRIANEYKRRTFFSYSLPISIQIYSMLLRISNVGLHYIPVFSSRLVWWWFVCVSWSPHGWLVMRLMMGSLVGQT